jgi:phage protein D
MTTDTESIVVTPPTVRAAVTINGAPIASTLYPRLTRVVVDNAVNLPGMFELTFLDYDGTTLAQGGIQIGSTVAVAGADVAPDAAVSSLSAAAAGPLITGEVTALEAVLAGQRRMVVVRGYTLAHRLQRARKSRPFVNMTDSDIAAQIATDAGLTPGTITPTTAVHSYLAQVNQTDWEFLRSRALEIGYEAGVSNGQFYFTSAAVPASTTPVSISFPSSLFSFRPRVSSGNLTPDVEVRVWDPMAMQAFAAPANTASGGPVNAQQLGTEFKEGGAAGAADSLASGITPDVAAATQDMSEVSEALSDIGAVTGEESELLGGAVALGSPLGTLGPTPSPTAHIVTDRPVATSATMATSGQACADALGTDLSGTFAEAEGETFGNPAIQPGALLSIQGTLYPFDGEWQVSHARHVFDDSEFGYRTVFAAHGRQDRSMLGLTSGGSAERRPRPAIEGVVCGVVSNVFDVLGRGRVKVTLPWLSPTFETDWAPVAQPCVGTTGGTLFLPSVGDEVLVAFEQGDPRRPYVVGSFVNNYTGFSLVAAGPAETLSSISGGLGGMAGQLASAAGGLESVASDIASMTVAGALMNASGMQVGSLTGGSPQNLLSASEGLGSSLTGLATSELANDASMTGEGMIANMAGANIQGNMTGMEQSAMGGMGLPSAGMSGLGAAASGMADGALMPGLGAVQQSPGMVGEVVRRGYVSDTGNVLVFNDQSIPGPAAATPSAGASPTAGGASPLAQDVSPPGGGLGTMGSAGSIGGGEADAGGQVIASNVTLGSQSGNLGVYVDQVATMVMLQSNPVPGVSMSPMPMLVISAGGPAGAAGSATSSAGGAASSGSSAGSSGGGGEGGGTAGGAAGASGASGGEAAAAQGSIIISAGTDVTIASEGTLTLMAPEIMIAGETVTVVGELIPLTPG